jgi:hypothetical protein
MLERMNDENPPVQSDISHEALGFLLLQYGASLLMENPPSPGAQTYLDESFTV